MRINKIAGKGCLMRMALAWQDQAVIVAYLVGMIVLGACLARKQQSQEQYFLAGRRMPWFVVGVSVIASLLSSLTYLSEPGEVWNSGVSHLFGKMLAIPFEMAIVWIFCIPFMMRFRFTSVYEYLEHRFGHGTRLLGVALFVVMVLLWMGLVVLASARALAHVSGVPLWVVVAVVGIVATTYTMLGGLRAVVWTDVVQVTLLIGGGLFAIGFVAVQTGTWLPDWYQAMARHLADPTTKGAALAAGVEPPGSIRFFSASPFVRVTVVTVAINMCIWHVCTHTANQMTVQRYFSTANAKSARRSFVTGSLFGVGLNLMLVVVGLAVLYYYWLPQNPLQREGLDPLNKNDRDLIFSTFAVNRLPPGLGGAILAALLAAAMSTIDSGVNSMATVLTVELKRRRIHRRLPNASQNSDDRHVVTAKWITLTAGLFITVAAYGLHFIPGELGIIGMMPRTFNAITGPLGGLFFIGMFMPAAGGRTAVLATSLGLLTSLSVGYFHLLGVLLLKFDFIDPTVLNSLRLLTDEGTVKAISFTWIMPAALLVTLISAAILSRFENRRRDDLSALTWYNRHQTSPLTDNPEP